MARAVQAVQEQRTPEFMSSVETGAEAASDTAEKMGYLEKRTMWQNPLCHETCRLMMMPLQEFRPERDIGWALRKLRDAASYYVRTVMTTYGGMLTATYVSAQDSPDANVKIEPPLSQEFVMSRIYQSTQIILFEAVRRTLLLDCEDEDRWKSVMMVVDLLTIAEREEHVKYPLMSKTTSALLDRCLQDVWVHLQSAEPPNMKHIAEVPWLAYEVYGLIEPNHFQLSCKLRDEQHRMYEELWPTPERLAKFTESD